MTLGHNSRVANLTLSFLVPVLCSLCQTTQGLITGQAVDSRSGQPVAAAAIEWENAYGTTGASRADGAGLFYIPQLSPGTYRVRAAAPGYQTQEIQELQLNVAGRLELDFRLRPLDDVWEASLYRSVFLKNSRTLVTFYGPDVDTSRSGSFEAQPGRQGLLESAISQIIDRDQLLWLPLGGRDAYTLLVTQPGVTADSGTARGLGMSVAGQRPSSSNFLLDGLENNNYLVTGALTPLPPEVIQEYRASTNNFSAEYGRTSGFIANAITYSGTNQFHGMGYFYLKNDALNANEFQRNLTGTPRTPLKEVETGFILGGPVRKNRLHFSSALDWLRGRSRPDPVQFWMPTTRFWQTLPAGSMARDLATRFRIPRVDSDQMRALVTYEPLVSLDRWTGIERLDYTSRGNMHRLMARVSGVRTSRPDFVWNPYPDFISPLHQTTLAAMLGHVFTISPALVNDARAGYSLDDLRWDRANGEVPALTSSDGTMLPSAAPFYAYSNRNSTWQFLNNLMYTKGRHVVVAGAGVLVRRAEGLLAAGRDGRYSFPSLAGFAEGRANLLLAAVARESLPAPRQPEYPREYRYGQWFVFAQDAFRINSRLTLNYGVRYERFGSPVNAGTVKDPFIELASGREFGERLAGAALRFPGPGDQPLFDPDRNDWAGRFGFTLDLLGKAKTLVRGAYGTFSDRPFDNNWLGLRNNALAFSLFRLDASAPTNYLAPMRDVVPSLSGRVSLTQPPDLTLFDPNLRNPYVQSFFLGVQQNVTPSLSVEVNGIGTLGRKLLTTDVVNRDDAFHTRVNRGLPGNIVYRSGQGLSNYYALSAVVRYRASRAQLQASYTWGHSIDTQSEPLATDLFDYGFTTGQTVQNQARAGSGFLRQYDSRGDRGNSDFDQRHNLVFFSLWRLPNPQSSSWYARIARDWTVSQMAAVRTGFPFSAYGFFGRGDLLDPTAVRLPDTVPIAGGVRLFNREAFVDPFVSILSLGNTGRNVLRGPGLYNVDVALGRSFGVRWLGEGGRITIRADAFNILNHANLGNPMNSLLFPQFGESRYGRNGRQSGFPALSPLNERARQVQLVLRVQF